MGDTVVSFNVETWVFLTAMTTVVVMLLVIVWKAKGEIAQAIREEVSPLKTGNNRLVVAVTELQTLFSAKVKGATITNSLLERGASPLRPTVLGAKLIKDSGLEQILDTNKETLCIKLKAMLPKESTEYDVQEKARDLLLDLREDEMMNPLKEYVYNHPMDIKIILRTGALWLRDDYLKQPRTVAPDEPTTVESKTA